MVEAAGTAMVEAAGTGMAAATGGNMAATAGDTAAGIAEATGTMVMAIMDIMHRPFLSSFTVMVMVITTMNKAGRPWFKMG